MRLRYILLAVAICFGIPWTLAAQSIPIQNSSFELPGLGDGGNAGVSAPLIGTASSTINNWTMTATSLVAVGAGIPARVEIRNPTGAGPTNITGVNLGLLRANGLLGAATTGTLYQDLGVTYSATTRYILQADVGVEDLATLLSDFGVRLMAGTNVVAERDKNFLLTLLNNSNHLHRVTMIFDTPGIAPSGNIGVQFFSSSLANVGGAFIVDNVSLTATAVPEPTTIALIVLSVGGGAGAYWRHRRKVKQLLNETVRL